MGSVDVSVPRLLLPGSKKRKSVTITNTSAITACRYTVGEGLGATTGHLLPRRTTAFFSKSFGDRVDLEFYIRAESGTATLEVSDT